jgi:hypothetical protein
MGSRQQNFYNAAFARQGYGDDVAAVQDLWLAGRRDQAADRVPRELGLKTNLLGPPGMIAERLRLYGTRASPRCRPSCRATPAPASTRWRSSSSSSGTSAGREAKRDALPGEAWPVPLSGRRYSY